MLAEIEQFVNWVRRRNSNARTWRDYSYDLKQFAAIVGDRDPASISHQDIGRFTDPTGQPNMKLCRVFPPVHQRHQQLIDPAQFRWPSKITHLILQDHQHLFKHFPAHAGYTLKVYLSEYFDCFVSHVLIMGTFYSFAGGLIQQKPNIKVMILKRMKLNEEELNRSQIG